MARCSRSTTTPPDAHRPRRIKVRQPPPASRRVSRVRRRTRDRSESARSLALAALPNRTRSEEHTSELQSLMRISYAVFCLKKKTTNHYNHSNTLNKHDNTHNRTKIIS